jgi:hypothetical protein
MCSSLSQSRPHYEGDGDPRYCKLAGHVGTGRDSAYEAETRVERLCENRVRRVQDQLREQDLVPAFVDLWALVGLLSMTLDQN